MSEAVQFITEQGWTPQEKARRNGLRYLYAAQRKGKQIVWRYIAPVSKVEQLTARQITEQLEKQPKAEIKK